MTKDFLIALSLVTLVGCGTPVRKANLRDLAHLPRSEGAYGGKLFLGAPWLYFGSDDRFHYFRYTYTKENLAFQKRFQIPRTELRLPFETPFTSFAAPGVEVVPLHGVGSGIYGFIKAVKSRPEDADWTRHVPALPAFDEKL